MNHKTIKLHGGPHDGEVVEVLHSLELYQTTDHVDTTIIETFYRQTPHRSSGGEVVFSCYDYMLELR